MSLPTLIFLCVWVTGFFLLILTKPKGVSTPAMVIMFFIWLAAVAFAALAILFEKKPTNPTDRTERSRSRSQKDDK